MHTQTRLSIHHHLPRRTSSRPHHQRPPHTQRKKRSRVHPLASRVLLLSITPNLLSRMTRSLLSPREPLRKSLKLSMFQHQLDITRLMRLRRVLRLGSRLSPLAILITLRNQGARDLKVRERRSPDREKREGQDQGRAGRAATPEKRPMEPGTLC